MAKATRSTVEVEKVIKEKVDTVTLELTMGEVQALVDVFGSIGCNVPPDTTVRCVTDPIYNLLEGYVDDYGKSPFTTSPAAKPLDVSRYGK